MVYISFGIVEWQMCFRVPVLVYVLNLYIPYIYAYAMIQYCKMYVCMSSRPATWTTEMFSVAFMRCTNLHRFVEAKDF